MEIEIACYWNSDGLTEDSPMIAVGDKVYQSDASTWKKYKFRININGELHSIEIAKRGFKISRFPDDVEYTISYTVSEFQMAITIHEYDYIILLLPDYSPDINGNDYHYYQKIEL